MTIDSPDDVVVMINPETGPFSHDPRWHDPAVREEWHRTHDDKGRLLEDPAEPAEEVDEEDIDYNSWTNEELRAELSERKLSVDGKKADMVKRLEDDDARAEG